MENRSVKLIIANTSSLTVGNLWKDDFDELSGNDGTVSFAEITRPPGHVDQSLYIFRSCFRRGIIWCDTGRVYEAAPGWLETHSRMMEVVKSNRVL